MRFLKLFIIITLVCGLGCKIGGSKEGNKVLAKVYNKNLLYSDLDGMFPEGSSHDDSIKIMSGFAERWVRENLMMYEAERNIPKDLNIDELVKKYRSSLILSNYERSLTEESLDSLISDQELQEFYEKNKEQYQLETPIVRCYFIKVSRPTPEVENLRTYWDSRKDEDFAKLVAYGNQYATVHLLTDTVWYKIDDIINDLPTGTLSAENVSTGRELTIKDDNFQYFLRILSVKSKKEIAPLEFIKEQAKKFILHKRKIKLIEDQQEKLYDQESRRRNAVIYLD